MTAPLLIRADASAAIGTGHVMRCLALAQAWQARGGAVTFVMAGEVSPLEARLKKEGMQVVYLAVQPGSDTDAQETAARATGASWVVIDGYRFDAAYQQVLKAAGCSVLMLDDYGQATHYYADLILNQNIDADLSRYAAREPYTTCLLGTRYAMLRREFWPWQTWTRTFPARPRHVIATLGGSDPNNLTGQVLQAIERLNNPEAHYVIVAGASSPHYPALAEAVATSTAHVELRQDVKDMSALMAWADVAISAGGSTCWELAFMGVPNLIVILAENQRSSAMRLEAEGVSQVLGWHEELTPATILTTLRTLLEDLPRWKAMAHVGRNLVDGQGAKRVVAAMQ